MDGLDKMECIHRALAVVSGSGLCRAGFAGIVLRAVSLHVVVRPLMLGIMAGMNQRDSCVSRQLSLGDCSDNHSGSPVALLGQGVR